MQDVQRLGEALQAAQATGTQRIAAEGEFVKPRQPTQARERGELVPLQIQPPQPRKPLEPLEGCEGILGGAHELQRGQPPEAAERGEPVVPEAKFAQIPKRGKPPEAL